MLKMKSHKEKDQYYTDEKDAISYFNIIETVINGFQSMDIVIEIQVQEMDHFLDRMLQCKSINLANVIPMDIDPKLPYIEKTRF